MRATGNFLTQRRRICFNPKYIRLFPLLLALTATVTARILIAISYTTTAAAYERPQSFKFVSLHSASEDDGAKEERSGENLRCACIFSAHNFTCERRATIADTSHGRIYHSINDMHTNPSLSAVECPITGKLTQEQYTSSCSNYRIAKTTPAFLVSGYFSNNFIAALNYSRAQSTTCS